MKTYIISLITIILSIGVISCQQENTVSEKFKEAVPQEYMVKLDVPENQKHLKDLGDVAESYLNTVQVTRDVNSSVLLWLSWVKTITAYPASSFDDNHAIWGPWLPDDGLSSVKYRFTMDLNEDGSFDYAFQLKPKEADDSQFVSVYTGHINAGGNQTTNSGSMFFDLTSAGSVDLSVDSTGTIEVEYAYDNGEKDITVGFTDWAEHKNSDLLTANYHYFAATSNEGYFDFETWADIHAGTADAATYPNDEHWQLRSRWTANGDGRCDVIITGEDLDTAGISDFHQSECWDNSFMSVYLSQAITTPNDGVTEDTKWGEESSCTNFMTWEGPAL